MSKCTFNKAPLIRLEINVFAHFLKTKILRMRTQVTRYLPRVDGTFG
jgi:hypothetical protein